MKEIFAVFGRLGFLGFGGPIATMGMMEEEACQKRKWLSTTDFAEIYTVVKMLPGPASTQMAVYLGYLRGGVVGGILAGTLFILPCFFVVLGYSIWYSQRGAVAMGSPVLFGFQLGALVVIGLSVYQLGKPYLKHADAWVIALVSAGVVLWQPRLEPLVIFGFGMTGAFVRGRTRPVAWMPWLTLGGLGGAAAGALKSLFWVSLKSGAFVFGTGLAIIPLLEGEAVQHHHWLTHSEFMDGLAIGQVTPGPVVATV
ncbi:MAG: chromate efflux transporter, partial [Bdellovibrionota bacterium]